MIATKIQNLKNMLTVSKSCFPTMDIKRNTNILMSTNKQIRSMILDNIRSEKNSLANSFKTLIDGSKSHNGSWYMS